MTQMVQVAIAGDVTEAEELEAILREAGITRSSSRPSTTTRVRRTTFR